MRVRIGKWLIPFFAVPLLLGLTACEDDSGTASDQRKESIETRAESFEKAEALYPPPVLQNFTQRSDLVKMSERKDLANHPWYVYILADTGNVIGYYVASVVPTNSCAFLSSSEDIHSGSNGKVVMTAPSLDGIYYGGGGSSSNCDEWFFFDAATDAMIKIRGVKFFVADQPLSLEADPIEVAAAEQPEAEEEEE